MKLNQDNSREKKSNSGYSQGPSQGASPRSERGTASGVDGRSEGSCYNGVRYRRLLTIAGSDSGGGAGIQADLKTFSALGCFGMSVITALTAQNTHSVTGIHPVPPEFIRLQIDTVMEDIGVDAVKVGMLHSAEVIRTVAEALEFYRIPYVVVDPVMVAKGGAKLLEDDAVEALRTHLLPLATVITPNLPEAQVLLGQDRKANEGIPALHRTGMEGGVDSVRLANVPDSAALEDMARRLSSFGPQAVLVKGGHLEGPESPDVLYLSREDRVVHLTAPRIQTQNTHGTGCTLSSAIASFLARGESLEKAVRSAKEYLTEALAKGARYRLGTGHGPVHHFHAFWE